MHTIIKKVLPIIAVSSLSIFSSQLFACNNNSSPDPGGDCTTAESYTWDLRDIDENGQNYVVSDTVNGDSITINPIVGYYAADLNTDLTRRALGSWSYGTGVNGSNDSHTVDNAGEFDSILFSFSEEVELTCLTMGYINNDADFSLLAYTPSSGLPIIPTLGNSSYNKLQSNGWSLVSNNYHNGGDFANSKSAVVISDDSSANSGVFNNDTSDHLNPNIGQTGHGTSSSYWLVTAINGAFGSHVDEEHDFFKIASLVGIKTANTPPPPAVPEPTTLALFVIALIALFTIRQKKQSTENKLDFVLLA